MATKDDSTKRAALKLLRKGLISQTEAADLAGVSRQLMGHWAREIDVRGIRRDYVAALWERTTRRTR